MKQQQQHNVRMAFLGLFLVVMMTICHVASAAGDDTSSEESKIGYLRRLQNAIGRQLQDEPGDDVPETVRSCPAVSLEPPVPGVASGTNGIPNIVLAVGTAEPPFTQLGSASDGFPLSGFVVDVGLALSEVCDINIQFSQAPTATCFTSFGIGERLVEGNVHGCANYLKTPGMRNRQADFTLPLADNRAPGALLTRLDSEGNPSITGMDDLEGKTIIDIPGIVPNPDELFDNINPCTGNKFDKQVTFITTPDQDSSVSGLQNDKALKYLLDGNGDGLWINAWTPESFRCDNVPNGTTPDYDCTLWDGLGTTYAYVQTGIPSTALSGTTLAMSKKGSNLSQILDPCIEAFLKTQRYYEICDQYGLADTEICFPNDYFPSNAGENMTLPNWITPTNLLETEDCSTGYCPCNFGNADSEGGGGINPPNYYNETDFEGNLTDTVLTNPPTSAPTLLFVNITTNSTTEEDSDVEGIMPPAPSFNDTETNVTDVVLTNPPTSAPTTTTGAFNDTNVNVTDVITSTNGLATNETLEELCTDTGGEITTQFCCSGTDPFPSQLLIGACGCSPSDSEETFVCDCSDVVADDEESGDLEYDFAFDPMWGCINRTAYIDCEGSWNGQDCIIGNATLSNNDTRI